MNSWEHIVHWLTSLSFVQMTIRGVLPSAQEATTSLNDEWGDVGGLEPLPGNVKDDEDDVDRESLDNVSLWGNLLMM